jgi:uncharacterized protein YjbJ (UPF0337 family)
MNEQHVKGAADKVAGKTKEVVGHVTGSKKLETEGKVDQVKGAVRNLAGDAKDAGKEAIDSVKNAPSKH